MISNHDLFLITLGERGEALNSYQSLERRNTIAVLVCNHTQPSKYYRSRCNDVVDVGKIHRSLPQEWKVEDKEGAQKIYIEKECSVLNQREQCELCLEVDEKLVKLVKQALPA